MVRASGAKPATGIDITDASFHTADFRDEQISSTRVGTGPDSTALSHQVTVAGNRISVRPATPLPLRHLADGPSGLGTGRAGLLTEASTALPARVG